MVTKEHILKTAEELFFRYGVKSVTMDDIASHLGMSKKTIYTCFNDKDELLHEFARTFINRNAGAFESVCKVATNAIDEIFCVMKHLRSMIQQMNPKLFFELQKYYPKAWEELKNFREQHIAAMIQKNLEKGIKQELYRPDLNIAVLAKLRLEEVDMALNNHIFPIDKFNVAQVQITLFEHFLYGICTLKGHKLINKYKQITEEE
ncbi:MAG TPA: TetR/AcrR family transcriptional regulator [Bacteroidia bacterium]